MSRDVSDQRPKVAGFIDQVGLQNVKIPLWFEAPPPKGSGGGDFPPKSSVSLSGGKGGGKAPTGQVVQAPGTVTATVSLSDDKSRGVHMSRLYLTLHEFFKTHVVKPSTLQKLLKLLVKSQKGLSTQAFVRLSWELTTERPALLTPGLKGWRAYPVFYEAKWKKGGEGEFIMGMQITYSSTCPCSAALSREIVQKKFQEDWPGVPSVKTPQVLKWLQKESSVSATPHAQKSHAHLRIKVSPSSHPPFLKIIDEVEQALGTPVQTAVKKADEGEFARLNAKNLLFSEDAARRINKLLNSKSWIKGFHIEVQHLESLHPFDVICHISKHSSQREGA